MTAKMKTRKISSLRVVIEGIIVLNRVEDCKFIFQQVWPPSLDKEIY